ncbi:hypothetical protein NBRGN_065_00340 [Nocardia brasiliensis NBRC 14402]|uniref:hypothetical protein n=1 Tax=Nocardia brasiliensis TaxID=37326 RepID=UPI0002F966E5|nr:hypothetical protein [Nocardia brasiliensis]ASF10912.2 hypothetical protein CEQ30_30230 [Nocardia brasiliensis]GAJ83638.1 hypothetical protein NBRGN_065_00340 [Nocardia brasiliensis NBRC 14402]
MTELAGDTDALVRLSRAVDPDRYGFAKREPLNLSECVDAVAETVLDLLRAGQVPTPGALAAARTNPPNAHPRETHAQSIAEMKRIESTVRAHLDSLGEVLSSTIAMHWIANRVGPTWQEAWQDDRVASWWTEIWGSVPEYRLARKPMFSLLERAGWIASNHTPRSLIPGRRFHIHFFGDHVSQEPAHTIGFLVARYIGIHRRLHNDRSPSWADIAASATDAKGIPLFFNTYDARAQQEWLVTQGWIRVENDELRRGERAKSETRRRADLRKDAAGLRAA